jgi:Tfp pilus assembly protein PilX
MQHLETSNKEEGQILVLTLGVTAVVLLLVVALLSFVTFQYKLVRRSTGQAQALSIAEAGVDKAIRELNQSSSYAGESGTDFGQGEFTIEISGTGSERTITSTGSIPDETSPRYQKIIRVQAEISTDNVQFFYGVQVDDGGLTMANNAKVIGNVFSNGNITGGNNKSIVTGEAIVSGGLGDPNTVWETTNSDQQFGDQDQRQDAAQGFIPTTSGKLTRFAVYLKKVGNPGNLPVKIVTDNGGVPSKTALASSSIQSASIGTTYSWINVSFSPEPDLSASTRYWVILDDGKNANNYYLWGKDSGDGYGGATGKLSKDWNAGSPVWTSAGGDLDFRAWIGGIARIIQNLVVNGTARGNIIRDSQIDGDAYFQVLENTTVAGTQFPDSPDSSRQELPISDGVIADWKGDAEAGGVITGNFVAIQNQTQSLGPKKITGDLIVENGATLIITGTLWVQGNLVLDGQNGLIKLDPGYGDKSGLLVTDGWIHISNNLDAKGSGDPKSFIMLLSTADISTGPFTHHNSAIDLHNGVTGGIIYAGKGKIHLHQGVHVKELTGYAVEIEENAEITYDSGLADAVFSTGPGGGWGIKTGTWQELK